MDVRWKQLLASVCGLAAIVLIAISMLGVKSGLIFTCLLTLLYAIVIRGTLLTFGRWRTTDHSDQGSRLVPGLALFDDRLVDGTLEIGPRVIRWKARKPATFEFAAEWSSVGQVDLDWNRGILPTTWIQLHVADRNVGLVAAAPERVVREAAAQAGVRTIAVEGLRSLFRRPGRANQSG